MSEEKGPGHPLKFKTPEELEEKIQTYFDSCFVNKWVDEEVRDDKGKLVFVKADIGQGSVQKIAHVKVKEQIRPVTITGLAIALDTSRKVLLEYAEKDEYSNTITRAKAFIENLTEEGLLNGTIPTNGAIFNMKNNWGWVDKNETDLTTKGKELPTTQINYIVPVKPNKDEPNDKSNVEAAPGVAKP